MRLFIILFLCIFFGNNLYAKTINELIAKIANTTPTMQYLFWIAKDGNSNNVPYLTTNKTDGSFAVWHFTPDKKWQPIHNASEFDNFPKADRVFEDVSLNKIKEAITFGVITNNPANDDASKKAKILENKDFNIGWYFWVHDGDAFLFKEKSDREIAIWYFTPDKKWQPIHNANAFDGFEKADKNLEGLSFQASSGKLTIGKSTISTNDMLDENKPSFPKGITLKSNDIQNGQFLDEEYASISPSLSWDVNDELKGKDIIKSYAISLKDLDVNKYHWNIINIPNSTTSIIKEATINYQNSKNIMNDFGSLSYMGPFPPKGETHNYEFIIYAFATATINGAQDYSYAIYKSSLIVKYTGK